MKKKLFDTAVKLLSYKYKKSGYSDLAAEGMVMAHLVETIKGGYSSEVRRFAKKHGFLPSTVLALGITEDNYKDYLSDDDYYRLTPLDGEYHSWIDNKLTLKYLLGDLAGYMPLYYFQIMPDGRILRLFECSDVYEESADGILELLKTEKSLGIKRLVGGGGEGFYKAEYRTAEGFFVNDKAYSPSQMNKFIKGLKNYLILEYLESAGLPAKIYPKTANSIRVIIGVEDDKKYYIGNFIKFGDSGSGYVDNLTGGGISCPVNKNGDFNVGYTKVAGAMTEIHEHPDTHQILVGHLDEWDQIMELAHKIMKRLPQLTYCGFDFVISDKGIKLLEINDRSGFLTLQKERPLLSDKQDNFYLKRLKKINKA